jgi:hypothetical protein
MSCSVSLFCLCANGAIEEAVVSALLILGVYFLPETGHIACLLRTYLYADTDWFDRKLCGIRFLEEMPNSKILP